MEAMISGKSSESHWRVMFEFKGKNENFELYTSRDSETLGQESKKQVPQATTVSYLHVARVLKSLPQIK